jgi:DNA mismatch repair ATPase MutS
VVNRHVTAHASTGELVMMYEVKEGSCDQSFGIHVAKMCFPAEVVKAAERKLAELEQFGSVQQQAGAGAVSSPMDLALTAPVASTGMNKRPLDEKEEATLANMTTPDSKKQRVEADVAIKGFLKAFAALPVPSMESVAVIANVKEMKGTLDSRNPFLSQMLLRSE